jgi:Spy/CpxP family protein refolding chaperone
MGMETPGWKETLTEEQKMKADKMHLELKKAMSILEAKTNLKEAELNDLITQDNPDTKAIQSNINDIMEIKKEMMIKKYDHMVEMRTILTPEQRLSFDLGLSSGMGGMHQKGHH